MKPCNDQDIKKLVKENSNYEIKTTSKDILYAYQLEKQKEAAKQEEPSHKFKFGLIFGSLSAVVMTGVIATSFIFLNKKSENNNSNFDEIFSPAKNTTVKNQLLTFSSLTDNSSLSTLRKLSHINEVEDDNDNENDNLFNEDKLKEIAEVYEKVEGGVSTIFDFNEISVKTIEKEFSYANETYKYQDQFINKDNEIVSIFYHNDIEVSKDDEEVTSTFTGLYEFNETYFKAILKEEKEVEEDEEEIEVEIIFKSLDSNVPYTYVVKKESEFESQKSENSYSYMIFNKSITGEFDEEDALEAIMFEYEDDEVELSYLNNLNQVNAEFNHIKKVNETKVTFTIEYESQDFEGMYFVEVIYNEDNTRTYTSSGITITL